MTFLESLDSPAELRRLDTEECEVLAKEIRDHLITSVAGTGGHLGPNLGVVELTMGLHRVFDSPRDTIIFDVGHQTYVHKLITGRAERFSDRKSTRLNSSHVAISYAVFCLKKKNTFFTYSYLLVEWA